MEARYHKQKKLTTKPVPVKPNRELLARRKSLGHNLRYLSERKKADIPPLTPLHRLKRFKAIRDKNLKTKLKQTISRGGILKMEEADTTNQLERKKEPTTDEKDLESSTKSCPLKTKLHQEKLENQDGEKNGFIISEGNFSNGHNGTENGHSDSENMDNGSRNRHNSHENLDNGSENDHNSYENMDNRTELKDNGVEEPHASNVNGTDNVSTTSTKDLEEENEIDVVEDDISLKIEESLENQEKECEREKSIESDNGSSTSSSTFVSNKVHSSMEDIGESKPESSKLSVSDEEEIDVETAAESEKISISAAEDLRRNVSSKVEEEKKEALVGSKGRLASRIPRRASSTGSASSYKTAYGSLRIGGRRSITGRGLKRKSEEENEARDVKASPSLPSPRWRFFPSSVSRFWSPSLADALTPPSTPLRNIDDSMAVNLNEDSINSHLNDPDLFSDAKPPASKKPKWGCIVM